jgi:hypothetical protein
MGPPAKPGKSAPACDSLRREKDGDENDGLDLDGDVDLTDLARMLAAYGACEGDPDYDRAADFDGSGCVDLPDLAILLSHYGEGT